MQTLLVFRTVLCLAAGVLITRVASAQPGEQVAASRAPGHQALAAPTFDEATGRSLAHFPPSPTFDHLHMVLNLTWPDVARAWCEVTETLTVKARGRERGSLILHAPAAESMKLTGVSCAQRNAVAYKHAGEELELTLEPAALVDEILTFTFTYSLDFSGSKSEGLTYHPPLPEGKSETDRAPMIYSQGEAELNRRWFICHDFPNERLTTEVIAQVPPGFAAVSNGGLVEHRVQTDAEIWHWKMSKPHVNYLVLLAIGKWTKVELPAAKIERDGAMTEIPCAVWTAVGSEEHVRKAFAATPRMVEFFGRQFAEPYPWERYDQIVVRDYGYGGMENTTATIMGDRILAAKAPGGHDHDVLIAHELAHQWFGDLVTCRSWEHIWLNEAWATLAEALWESERAHSPAEALTAQNRVLEGYRDQQLLRNVNPGKGVPAMVDRRYPNPDAVFAKEDDPYAKGVWVLHMLRARVGAEAFWRGTREYLKRWRFDEPETSDFRREIERASGESLEQFFEQWCRHPGIPMIEYSAAWDEKTGQLALQWQQQQAISASRPAWELDLPVRLTRGERVWNFVIPIRSRAGTMTYAALPGEMPEILPDPDMQALCSVRQAPAAPPPTPARP